MITLPDLEHMKRRGEKFCCLTAYDASFANAIQRAGVELLLVGDSLGTVIQGHDDTTAVTMADMIYHTRCVRRGSGDAFLMADMPFASYASPEQAARNAAALCRAGAATVKLEGGAWLAPTVRLLRNCGIPVCGHVGLTPQSVHLFGGYRVQGKEPAARARIAQDAAALQDAGVALMVLECVPRTLAAEITAALDIPVIGIGAGPDTDAQILVLHDLLGLNPSPPRFVPDADALAGERAQERIAAWVVAVREGRYPAPEHCYDG